VLFILAIKRLSIMFNFFQPEFKLAAGVKVADLRGIKEGFSVEEADDGASVITVNVSAEKLQTIYLGLAGLVRVPGFAVVEIPSNEKGEVKLRKDSTAPFHKDTYYLDGISFDYYQSFFLYYSPLFIDDGFITFGFGTHSGYDEVFVGRYKIFSIHTDEPRKYVQYLKAQKYQQRLPLKTVYDTFTRETPGSTEMVTIRGKTIYDLIEHLQQKGFYFAERREEV
jgi:hypothetical protein